MYERHLNLDEAGSAFLFGPRGTGKSYWLRHVYPDSTYLDLLEADTYNLLLSDPGRLEQLVDAGRHQPVVIDEIQRVPELLNEVHRLIELRGARFILTGSSARKLRRGSSNLLAGRAVTKRLHPLTAGELGEDFDIGKALSYGMLPTLYDAEKDADPRKYLAGYIQTYLREEVLQEGLTRNLAAFSRFLAAASFSQGSVLNMTEAARECAVGRKVASGYFEVLEDLLIAVRVPAFAKRVRRRIVQHPKFFFFDAGVYRAIRPKGPLDAPEQIDVPVLETLVLQHLRAVIDAFELGYEIHYWRTLGGAEVDFVLYGEDGLVAIEVKRKRTIGRNDLRGLSAFRDEYPMARCLVFANTARRMSIGDVQVVPIARALSELPEILVPPRG